VVRAAADHDRLRAGRVGLRFAEAHFAGARERSCLMRRFRLYRSTFQRLATSRRIGVTYVQKSCNRPLRHGDRRGCSSTATPAAAPSGSTATAPAALTLTPPWKGPEHAEYNIVKDSDNSALGTSTINIQPASDAPRSTAPSNRRCGAALRRQSRSTTLKPLVSDQELAGSPNDFSLTGTYADNKLTVTAKTAQGDKNATIDVSPDAYDNNSLLRSCGSAVQRGERSLLHQCHHGECGSSQVDSHHRRTGIGTVPPVPRHVQSVMDLAARRTNSVVRSCSPHAIQI